jgi:hypothetical protein
MEFSRSLPRMFRKSAAMPYSTSTLSNNIGVQKVDVQIFKSDSKNVKVALITLIGG